MPDEETESGARSASAKSGTDELRMRKFRKRLYRGNNSMKKRRSFTAIVLAAGLTLSGTVGAGEAFQIQGFREAETEGNLLTTVTDDMGSSSLSVQADLSDETSGGLIIDDGSTSEISSGEGISADLLPLSDETEADTETESEEAGETAAQTEPAAGAGETAAQTEPVDAA